MDAIIINANVILMNADTIFIYAGAVLINTDVIFINAGVILMNAYMIFINARVILINSDIILINAGLNVAKASVLLFINPRLESRGNKISKYRKEILFFFWFYEFNAGYLFVFRTGGTEDAFDVFFYTACYFY